MTAPSCEALAAAAATSSTVSADYMNVIMCTLTIYEYFVTFDQEIRMFWRKASTIPRALFLLNRYNILCNAVVVLLLCVRATRNTQVHYIDFQLSQFYAKVHSLYALKSMLSISVVIAYSVTAFFTALRVYALWGKDKKLFIPIFVLASAPAWTSVACWLVQRSRLTVIMEMVGSVDCEVTITMDPNVHMWLTWAGQLPSIVSDVLVLVLTWIKSYDHVRDARSVGMKVALSTLIVRDGTLYFVILVGLHATQLVVSRSLCLAQLLYIMSSVLVSRFLLNLRQVNEQSLTGDTEARHSTLRFAAAVGGLSEPLALADSREDDYSDAARDEAAL